MLLAGLVYQTRALAITKKKRTSTKKEEPEPEAEEEVWTTEQEEALTDAKLKISTTAPNFWVQVRANNIKSKLGRGQASQCYALYGFDRWHSMCQESQQKTVKPRHLSIFDPR